MSTDPNGSPERRQESDFVHSPHPEEDSPEPSQAAAEPSQLKWKTKWLPKWIPKWMPTWAPKQKANSEKQKPNSPPTRDDQASGREYQNPRSGQRTASSNEHSHENPNDPRSTWSRRDETSSSTERSYSNPSPIPSRPEPYHKDYRNHRFSPELERIRREVFKGPPSVTIGGRRVVFFFSFRVKWGWNSCLAYVELILTWIVLLFTFLATVAPGDSNVATIGMVAMFSHAMLLHLWYGFYQYPSTSKSCLLQTLGDRDNYQAEFEEMRDMLSYLYHGDDIKRNQTGTILASLFVSFFSHLASFVASMMTCLACYSGQEDGREILVFSARVGLVCGSLLYPIIFAVGGPGSAVLAAVGSFVTEEMYLALLFRKSFFEFFKSCILSVIYDFVPIPVDADADDGFEDPFEDIEESLDERDDPYRRPPRR